METSDQDGEKFCNLLEPDRKRFKASSDTEEGNTDEKGGLTQSISKRQLKKMLKKEKWLAYKAEKRAKEKERKKQRKAEARSKNLCLGPSRKILKGSTMAKSSCRIQVAIDLSFDDLMNDKVVRLSQKTCFRQTLWIREAFKTQAISKCVKQVGHCYSLNRRAKNPMQLYLTSFNGKSKEQMAKNVGYENWDIHFSTESYLDIFKKDDVVYLCSESENVISSLSEDKVYVIGGLVDHNAHKGLTFRLAEERNIHHCQLPLQEYIHMNSRKVLTIDHVFEILLGVSEGMSWKDAFLRVLPARKGAVEKDGNETKLSPKTSTVDVTL